jgi:hypothetical protein
MRNLRLLGAASGHVSRPQWMALAAVNSGIVLKTENPSRWGRSVSDSDVYCIHVETFLSRAVRMMRGDRPITVSDQLDSVNRRLG